MQNFDLYTKRLAEAIVVAFAKGSIPGDWSEVVMDIKIDLNFKHALAKM